MKRISLLALLFAGVLASGLLAAEDPNSPKLAGREIMVRVYKDWRREPAAFNTVKLEAKDCWVNLDFSDANDNTVVVVLKEDQSDGVVREFLTDTIYASPYQRDLTYTPVVHGRSQTQGILRTFVDALGDSLAGATAEIYIKREGRNRPKVCLGQVQLDKTSQLKLPIATGELRAFHIVLSHPECGIAVVELGEYDKRVTVHVPLVRAGTEADERSIWGTVVDPNNNPVEGALIKCYSIYPPGGSSLVAALGDLYRVQTDDKGRFSMYLPLEDGKMVPPNSIYEIEVEPPDGLDLLPYGGIVHNGQESTIVMKRAGYFHTFAFEDGNSTITDPNKLKQIYISIDGNFETLKFEYDDWKNGRMFPLGAYKAVIPGRRPLIFEPIVVVESSPTELVFKAEGGIIYYGQVVNGITGERMPGIIVLGGHNYLEDASAITPEQWKAIHALGDNLSANDKALEPLRELFGFSKVTQTDNEGGFQISFEPRKDGYFGEFVALEEDWLVGSQDREEAKPNGDRYAHVPNIMLFPAAKILLEPCVEDVNDTSLVRMRWRVDRADNPSSGDNPLPCRHSSMKVEPNRVYSMDVPGGFNMRIELKLRKFLSDPNQQWSLIVIEGLNLQQGETLDLGKLTFERMFPIYLKVTNLYGKAVEGVTVRNACQTSRSDYYNNTDTDGMAKFSVPPYSKGEFSISCYDESRLQIKEAITYEVAGVEDANSVFTLKVSDELLYQLFK